MAAEYSTRSRATAAVCLLLIVAACRPRASESRHPLDPLDAEEINAARRILVEARQLTPDRRAISIDLAEPSKATVLAGRPIGRRAIAVLYEARRNATTEVVVDLTRGSIERSNDVPGVQPAVDATDAVTADSIVRHDSAWRAAIARRGIAPSDVAVDVWTTGQFDDESPARGRIVRAAARMRSSTPSEMARPIEGVVALLDLSARRVLRVDDDGLVPVPSARSEIDAWRALPSPSTEEAASPPWSSPMWRSTAPPIDGHAIRWRRWRLRAGLRPRDGLVLYDVGFDDGTAVRRVLYSASLSEMVVPYGDPGAGWFFRNAFDEGEFGLGATTESLRPGVDCPSGAGFIDGAILDRRGEARRVPRAIAVFERDGGLEWKHGAESRRARELVLLSMSHVGNYDYGFEWSFHEDGTIAHRVLLTGVMAVKGAAAGHVDSLGHAVTPGAIAIHHQHFFNYRLDLDVDGPSPNQLEELETHALQAGPSNRYQGGFALQSRTISSERDGPRHLDASVDRRWLVTNPSHRSALGQASAYELVPGANAAPFASVSSPVRRRAGFLDAPLWVTTYADSERYSAGRYPNQSAGGDGLPRWVTAGRSLTGGDLVLWYTVGVTHNPRPEDWPVMPVHAVGFELKPVGFFDRNPLVRP